VENCYERMSDYYELCLFDALWGKGCMKHFEVVYLP